MADADDGMAAIEIKIFGAVGVPNVATKTFGNFDVKERIYGIKLHVSVLSQAERPVWDEVCVGRICIRAPRFVRWLVRLFSGRRA